MIGKPLRSRANRRVGSKSIETRQRILDAAARALAEHGYSEARLSDIAEEAGTHAGNLYYYFTSREDLVKEVLLTSLSRMSEFSSSLEGENAHLSPLNRVLAFVRLVIAETMSKDDYYLRAYMRNGNQVPPKMHKVLKTRRQRMRWTLVRLLTEAQAAGQLPPRLDTNIAAQFIIGATSWVHLWYKPDGPLSVDEITTKFIDLVLHGLLGAQAAETRIPATVKTSTKPRKRAAGGG